MTQQHGAHQRPRRRQTLVRLLATDKRRPAAVTMYAKRAPDRVDRFRYQKPSIRPLLLWAIEISPLPFTCPSDSIALNVTQLGAKSKGHGHCAPRKFCARKPRSLGMILRPGKQLARPAERGAK